MNRSETHRSSHIKLPILQSETYMNISNHQSPPLPLISPSSHCNPRHQATATHHRTNHHFTTTTTDLGPSLSKPRSNPNPKEKAERERASFRPIFCRKRKGEEAWFARCWSACELVSSGAWWRRRLSELRPWTVESERFYPLSVKRMREFEISLSV